MLFKLVGCFGAPVIPGYIVNPQKVRMFCLLTGIRFCKVVTTVYFLDKNESHAVKLSDHKPLTLEGAGTLLACYLCNLPTLSVVGHLGHHASLTIPVQMLVDSNMPESGRVLSFVNLILHRCNPFMNCAFLFFMFTHTH